jgi:hypothetical protein
MTEQLESDAIADRLHDVLLKEVARMAPTGGGRTVPISTLCDALVTLLASFLIASQPAMPPDPQEIERLTKLFRQRLEEALAERADRSGGPIGHA